jgi:hypothetical protein
MKEALVTGASELALSLGAGLEELQSCLGGDQCNLSSSHNTQRLLQESVYSHSQGYTRSR